MLHCPFITNVLSGERPEPTGAGPGGGPREERGEAPYRQPEARQGKHKREDDILKRLCCR